MIFFLFHGIHSYFREGICLYPDFKLIFSMCTVPLRGGMGYTTRHDTTHSHCRSGLVMAAFLPHGAMALDPTRSDLPPGKYEGEKEGKRLDDKEGEKKERL